MKLHGTITVNGKTYHKGDEVPWYAIYPFFLVHMLMFGGSGFFMAYFANDVEQLFLFMHGGIAILVYTIFYLVIFGADDVKWMFINAFLGLLGIYTQMGWILDFFGKEIGSYPFQIHVIPFLYFVLYTFLLRQAVIDMTASRESARQERVEKGFVGILSSSYLLSYFLN
jgi:hypothetical protein